MEPISQTLKKIANDKNFEKRLEHLRGQVFQNEDVQHFLQDHPEVTEKTTQHSLSRLFEFTHQSVNCANCPSLDACKNILKGHYPRLFLHHGQIELRYERCRYQIRYDEVHRQQSLIQSLYVPKEILQARMGNVDLSEAGRSEAVEVVDEFVQRFQSGQTDQGLYFYGGFGVGKTYLMGAVANELAEKKRVHSFIVYTPDFFREMKAAIADQTVQQKLEAVKKAPVLILDDIGAETISAWIRDDVLGALLQYRMMERLPTLYTSNYDYDELEEHLAYSSKSGTERLKAKRVMERIRPFTKALKVGGENRRHVHPTK